MKMPKLRISNALLLCRPNSHSPTHTNFLLFIINLQLYYANILSNFQVFSISHPNVVHLHEGNMFNGMEYVMEHVTNMLCNGICNKLYVKY